MYYFPSLLMMSKLYPARAQRFGLILSVYCIRVPKRLCWLWEKLHGEETQYCIYSSCLCVYVYALCVGACVCVFAFNLTKCSYGLMSPLNDKCMYIQYIAKCD